MEHMLDVCVQPRKSMPAERWGRRNYYYQRSLSAQVYEKAPQNLKAKIPEGFLYCTRNNSSSVLWYNKPVLGKKIESSYPVNCCGQAIEALKDRCTHKTLKVYTDTSIQTFYWPCLYSQVIKPRECMGHSISSRQLLVLELVDYKGLFSGVVLYQRSIWSMSL